MCDPVNITSDLLQEIVTGTEGSPTMYGDLFDQLLTFVGYAVRAPRFGKVEAKAAGSAKMVQVCQNLLRRNNSPKIKFTYIIFLLIIIFL